MYYPTFSHIILVYRILAYMCAQNKTIFIFRKLLTPTCQYYTISFITQKWKYHRESSRTDAFFSPREKLEVGLVPSKKQLPNSVGSSIHIHVKWNWCIFICSCREGKLLFAVPWLKHEGTTRKNKESGRASRKMLLGKKWIYVEDEQGPNTLVQHQQISENFLHRGIQLTSVQYTACDIITIKRS